MSKSSSVGGIIASILIALVASVGLSAGGFGIGYGAGVLLGDPAQEPTQQETAEGNKQEPQKASCSGPNLVVENGTVTWMSETWARNGGRSIPGYENLVDAPAASQLPNTVNNPGEEQTTTPTQDQAPAQTPGQPDQQQGQTKPSTSEKSSGVTANPANQSGGQSQAGVNIDPSSPADPKTQNSGTQFGGSSKPSGNTSNGGSYAENFAAGKVLATTASANKGDPVYHTKYCNAAQKIAPNDMKWYNSAKEAKADHRRICGNCD